MIIASGNRFLQAFGVELTLLSSVIINFTLILSKVGCLISRLKHCGRRNLRIPPDKAVRGIPHYPLPPTLLRRSECFCLGVSPYSRSLSHIYTDPTPTGFNIITEAYLYTDVAPPGLSLVETFFLYTYRPAGETKNLTTQRNASPRNLCNPRFRRKYKHTEETPKQINPTRLTAILL